MEVDDVEDEVVLTEVELVEVVMVVNELVLVDVELVEVLEVELDVLLVLVDEVEVEVVILSRGNNSPTATLYTRPTTPAEALEKLVWLIALMYGSIALDRSLGSPPELSL